MQLRNESCLARHPCAIERNRRAVSVFSRKTRPLTDPEMEVVRRAPFLEPRARRAAKEHAAHGIVEVIEFDVRDVWKLISCSGPPWCPSTWLVKVDADAFVYMWS